MSGEPAPVLTNPGAILRDARAGVAWKLILLGTVVFIVAFAIQIVLAFDAAGDTYEEALNNVLHPPLSPDVMNLPMAVGAALVVLGFVHAGRAAITRDTR